MGIFLDNLYFFNKIFGSGSLQIIDGPTKLISLSFRFFDKKITYSDQDDNDATYANKISSLNRKINFNKSVNEVLNLIKPHSPKPGAWFTIQNERIKIIKARKSNSNGNASTILNETFDIGCNDGSIEPLILQREGKNAISKDDFLRGYSLKINDIINA